MIEQYKKELKDLETRMVKAEEFAKKLPVFADRILKNKYTGEEAHLCFGDFYKETPIKYGIYREYYNYPREMSDPAFENAKIIEFQGFLFKIYVSCRALFNMYENFGLYEKMGTVDIFYIDKMNFYVTDENIEHFLETLNNWYVEALEKSREYSKQKRKEELLKELEGLR